MVGEATFYSGHFRMIIGGKFLDAKVPESAAPYNCDVLIVDNAARKMYALPLSYFPAYVADQFSGVHFSYTFEKDTAYIMGGFGYDLTENFETTFPTMTIFSVKTLIDSVVHHKDYLNLFTVVNDSRLAIMEGNVVRIGDYFMVYNGRKIAPVKEEFSDRLTISEWDFKGQMRKFKLKNTAGFPEVDEFQVCTTAKTFYQCMPDTWHPEPVKAPKIAPNKR